jgi:Holliday junction resolvasome RuvABC endonuclease subunit
MTYIGIDPGLNGAVAIITDNSFIKIIDTPIRTVQVPSKKSKSGKKNKRLYVESDMANIFRMYNHTTTMVCIEKQWARTKEGVSSSFTNGYGYGLWIGIIKALDIKHRVVTPMEWKKVMIGDKGADKSISCELAKEIFPQAELYTKRGRALDGRGDALLIGEYYRRIINNN